MRIFACLFLLFAPALSQAGSFHSIISLDISDMGGEFLEVQYYGFDVRYKHTNEFRGSESNTPFSGFFMLNENFSKYKSIVSLFHYWDNQDTVGTFYGLDPYFQLVEDYAISSDFFDPEVNKPVYEVNGIPLIGVALVVTPPHDFDDPSKPLDFNIAGHDPYYGVSFAYDSLMQDVPLLSTPYLPYTPSYSDDTNEYNSVNEANVPEPDTTAFFLASLFAFAIWRRVTSKSLFA